jgi:hypothetical protein
MSEEIQADPKRITRFAHFFKNYVSTSSVVAAALPIPATSFKLIPTLPSQTSLLSVYTSLFCFLLLAYIFYQRRLLAKLMFCDHLGEGPSKRSTFVALLPAILAAFSFASVILYHSLFESYHLNDGAQVPATPVPVKMTLMCSYMFIFLFAEAAFILMAIKEHLQDIAGLTETRLIAMPKIDLSGPLKG